MASDASDKFMNNYIKPRDLSPLVMEGAIQNGNKAQGNRPNTWCFETKDVKISTADSGKVVTVIPE